MASWAGGKGGEGKGLPEGADNAGCVAGGCRAELSGICGGASGLRRDKSCWRARRAGASAVAQSTWCGRRASLHLPALSLGQVPRTPPKPQELAEPQAAGGGQKKGDKTPGGGGANLKGDRSRLLRDLRGDTRSRTALARLLQEQKYKGGNKKPLSKGCFGLKLDRIGSMSGLGC